ncbi:MAG: hypothetical protein R3358_06120 [Woeseiaceae bacterium]|nr:hypothetical protein [Woeseiaceae bacterium]
MTTPEYPALTIEQLERGDIEPGGFDHEGHVYLGWLYVGEFGAGRAIEKFTAALRRLVGKLGVPDKYHDTITWFYLLVIAERRSRDGGDDWPTFRRDNPDLFSRDDNVLSRFYSRELLASEDARRRFVLPDRIAA